jgi:hypothetical protein
MNFGYMKIAIESNRRRRNERLLVILVVDANESLGKDEDESRKTRYDNVQDGRDFVVRAGNQWEYDTPETSCRRQHAHGLSLRFSAHHLRIGRDCQRLTDGTSDAPAARTLNESATGTHMKTTPTENRTALEDMTGGRNKMEPHTMDAIPKSSTWASPKYFTSRLKAKNVRIPKVPMMTK